MVLLKNETYTSLKTNRWLMLMVMSLLLGACGQSKNSIPTNDESSFQVVEPRATTANSDSYPATNINGMNDYPVPSDGGTDSGDQVNQAYPATTNLPVATDKPKFQFINELVTGMTVVEGSAPPNLPLIVADITFNGAILGEGTSNGEGKFVISVSPLPEGHRIGLGLAALDEGKTFEQMVEELFPYRGDNYMNVPNVGVYFETTLVKP